MASARRTIARALAAVTLGCAGVAFSQLVAVREPFPATVYDAGSEAERALAVARANCEEHERSTGLARWSRGDAGETLRRACAGLPRTATGASDPAVAAVDNAHYDMRLRVQARISGAVFFLIGLSVAAVFAVAGFGRTAAVLALLALVLPGLTGVYEAIPVGVVAALLFLAAAPLGERAAGPPRHATSAMLVALLLVPLGVTAMLATGFGDISYHLDKRLGYTTAMVVGTWAIAGAPLTVLIHRARADAARDAALAAPLRIGFARLVLMGLIVATSAAYYGAIQAP